jgi:solute carrier family 8 (sodium/calcium exchanger)
MLVLLKSIISRTIASCYWAIQGKEFPVEIGSLAFSVTIFCIESLVAVLIIFIRRRMGGELGGPKKIKILSSAFFVFLWIIFITLSALEAYGILKSDV